MQCVFTGPSGQSNSDCFGTKPVCRKAAGGCGDREWAMSAYAECRPGGLGDDEIPTMNEKIRQAG